MSSVPIQVLLIEEDPVDADLIERTLLGSAGNFEVARVERLEDAFDRIASHRTDLILFSLSYKIGLSHLVQIRNVAPNLPIVVLTSLDDTFIALKAVREGAQDYLLKGQTSSTLLVRTLRYAIERKRSEEALRYRLEFEKLIATISTHFINIALEQMDRGINRALQAIGEFAGVDRCYLFQFSREGNRMSNTHEWCRDGIEPQIHRRKDVTLKSFLWLSEKIKRAETIHIQNRDDLPFEADAEKYEFELSEIQSMLCVPLIYCGDVVGFLGFDSVQTSKSWSQSVISLLKIAGDMFVNALERKRVQRELIESQQRLLLYSRSTNDVLWDWNIETGQMWWNENLQPILGYSPDSPGLDFKWWCDHIHPAERASVVAKIDRLLEAGGTFFVQEYRFECADHSYADVVSRGYVVFDEYQKPIHLVGAMIDITGQKKMEARYRQFLEDDLTGDLICTPDGNLLECNPAFVKIFGLGSKEEAFKTNVASLYQDHESWNDFLDSVRREKRLEFYDSELLHKNGNLLPVTANWIGVFNQRDELIEIRGYIFSRSREPEIT